MWKCNRRRSLGISAVVLRAFCFLSIFATRAVAAAEGEHETDAVLARVPPKSPAEALATFEVADGFRIEQVAAEPLLVDPVALAFDEGGQLYVVEMCDYSEQDQERLGRVRLLADDDGDGRFDRSRVFVADLSWPTAIACYDGGVFIGAAPDILYCKDTDGDGAADERRVVFTGFGRGNVQGLLNSFQWGLDHRIHGATSSAGGKINRLGSELPPLDLRGRDFAFDPKTLTIEATTGGGQHGMSFNRWGDRFVCSNSDHLQAIVFEERYLTRNPYQAIGAARRSIAADGPQAPVYRSSPIEAWRIARTKLRVAGRAAGPIEGGGQPAGYFTSATGITIYDGGLWGEDGAEWAFVADVGSNLVHRKRLVADGVSYRGERIDQQTEFVRSSDIWFRPVQFAIGPEGGLYVADMYREVIEHPASLPLELKRQLDLTSGRDRGRIYRIVPADFRQEQTDSLSSASGAELVAALDDANSWRRTTALRLIYERGDMSAATMLRAKFSAFQRPEGRIAVLYALASLEALAAADISAGLRDAHPQVRRHALRLSEAVLNGSARLRDQVMALSADDDRIVQFQLALTLGECDDPRTAAVLAASLVRHVDEPDLRGAALTAVGQGAGEVLRTLLGADKWQANPNAIGVIESLTQQILAQQEEHDLGILNRALLISEGRGGYRGRQAIVRTLARTSAAKFADSKLPIMAELARTRSAGVARLIREAELELSRGDAPLEDRLTAIQNLSLDSFENQREFLETLLSPQESSAIHAAVLDAFAEYDSPAVADTVLARWDQFSPDERLRATEMLLRRPAWALALLRHLKEQGRSLSMLDAGHTARLVNYPAAKVSKLARTLSGSNIAPDRRAVFREYGDVIAAIGVPARGKPVFEKHCASCHELGGAGQAVGPNLVSMISRGRESVLFNVLAPNGEVDPRYVEYSILTSEGQFVTGMIASETSTAVTLRAAGNQTVTVLRTDIDHIESTQKSLMPDGFETLIDKQAMADLLAYLEQAAATGGTSK